MLTNKYFEEVGKKSFEKVASLELIYKYDTLESGLNYILKDNTFKFSQPETFNDPFDSHESLISVVISKDKEKEFVLNRVAELNLPRKEKRKHLRNIGNPKNYSNVLRKERKKFKVSCFSEISDQILMWAHYADKHAGICIGFKFEPIYDDYVFYPVNYDNERRLMDGMTNTPYVFYHMVTQKAECWSYEKEIRAVTKKEASILSYPKEAVKEIIFGCYVKPPAILIYMKEIKEMGYKDIRFYKMEINTKTYNLDKLEISPKQLKINKV